MASPANAGTGGAAGTTRSERRVLERGQDLRAVLGDGDGVLEVGRQGAVDGSHRPVVLEEVRPKIAQGQHRLDGQAQTGLELAALATGAVVGDLRLLVHLGADAMTDELADDAVAAGLGDVLDGG